MIADPRAVAARWPDPRLRALAELACLVTEAPWALSREHHARARAAGLSDDDVLHAIALAAFFGHLNRIADAVDVPLDYRVRREPPRIERTVPPFLPAPAPVRGEPALSLASREATTAALTRWQAYVARPSAALDARRRSMIAVRVAHLVGDPRAGADGPVAAAGAHASADAGDRELLELADRITLAPWTFDATSYAPLRGLGFDDRGIFDACVAATTAGVASRIHAALVALGR